MPQRFSPAVLLLPIGALGCGGSAALTPAPPPTSEPAAVASTSGGSTSGATAVPREPLDWLSSDLVRCVRGAPEPEGPVIAGAGTSVRVRASSVVFDEDGERSVVCEAIGSVEGQLVLVLETEAYGFQVAVLEGDHLRLPDLEPVGIVRLPGATGITTVRAVRYCSDGTRDCVIAGDREAVSTYVDTDPQGPRSGWDLTTTALTTARVRRAGTRWLTDPVCGLEVGLRGAPTGLSCSGSVDEQLGCIAAAGSERLTALDELAYAEEGDAEAPRRRATLEREAAAFRIVLTDGRDELSVPAFDVASLACVDGHVLFRQASREFSSIRGYGAVEVRGGRIARGHTMSIRDHEESSSECGNAWDGVQLVPVLRGGVPVGGLVLGAGGRPFFELDRGDVGDVQTPAFWPAEGGEPPREVNETGFAYGDEPIPLALRETPEGLIAIASPDPAPPCTLVVEDDDGQTNVRPDASTRREPVGTLPNGTVIVPVEQRGRWYRVDAPARGWVFATSLRRRCESRPAVP